MTNSERGPRPTPLIDALPGEIETEADALRAGLTGRTPTSRPPQASYLPRIEDGFTDIPFGPRPLYTIGMRIMDLNLVSPEIATILGVRLEGADLHNFRRLGEAEARRVPQLGMQAPEIRLQVDADLTRLIQHAEMREELRTIAGEGEPTFRKTILGMLGAMSVPQLVRLRETTVRPITRRK